LFESKKVNNFGVMVNGSIFYNSDPQDIKNYLVQSINQHVSKYMSFLTIDDVKIDNNDDISLKVSVEYSVPYLNIREKIDFIDSNGTLVTTFMSDIPEENQKILIKYSSKQDRILLTDIKE
jgi:hypothetical protein